MQRYQLFFVFFVKICCTLPLYSNPLLVIILMVKNESAAMVPTLQPFVDAGIDSYLILDTGSTDDTIAVTRQFFEKNKIQHGYIHEQPFVDFSTSRNVALKYAEERFPQADFFLMIDAEWYMNNIESLLAFCRTHQHDLGSTYLVRIVSPWIEFYGDRLIRPRRGVHFIGMVHEGPNVVASGKVPYDVSLIWGSSDYSIEKSKQRWVRDKDILEEELKQKPGDPRTLFYLAQTYDCLNDWNKACFYYHMRCNVNGPDEENYMTRYRLAQVYGHQNQWDKALYYYVQAYSLRPTRAEPLIKIAEHYLERNDFATCFLFAQAALKIPYPIADTFLVEKWLYEYTRYDIMGRCAWYVGEFDAGRSAIMQALKAEPNAPHLKSNLSFYEPTKKQAPSKIKYLKQK